MLQCKNNDLISYLLQCAVNAIYAILLVSESRKMSQEKKNQDFGNIFSFPSYSQKTDDGELVLLIYLSLAIFTEYVWGFMS